MGDGVGNAVGEGMNQSHVLFDRFVQATTCKGTLKAFQELCDFLELKPNEYRVFYHKLKSKLNYWKAKALWAKLDKRASHKEYKKGRACANTKCLIIGAGPCGLRTAIELGFLGAKVILLEKRDAFSRNNVLHLWPFTIHDLRGLGAKKFYGKFCAGAIDHISIRQLQLMLLKVALLLGIEIHVNVEFRGLIEPPEDQENERIGWRAEVHPRTHPVNELEFDVIIGADGRRNTLSGFKRKEFRGKLAIAITANFINRNTTAEAKVEEISGVAFIFNQKFFQDLREATGIDLENIVYYKDDTHYFVMTAKKQSLLEKGVILHDYADTEMLLSRANVDQKALLSYAREAADFSTNHQLPKLDFAINHYGQPDVAMFDFTCMYASENAALVRQRNAHKLLVALVGDSLLEPFWPMGTGIARGFLAGMDAAWMVRSWAQGSSPLEVLAERESIYRLLPQTTPENVSKNFSQYSVDPTTRYPNISLHQVRPNQVRHLLDSGEIRDLRVDMENVVNSSTPKLTRNESIVRSSKLLNWCQRQTEGYRGVSVSDLTTCWKSGLALCALIHCYRPDLIDFDSLDEKDVEKNNQLGFDVAEKEFGISPIMTGKEMSVVVEPDKLSMVMYLSQFYEMFKDTVPPGENHNMSPEEKAALIASTKSPISFFSKLGQSIAISRKRNPKDKKEKELDGLGKRRKTSQAGQSEDEELQRVNRDDRPSIAAALAERKIDSAAAVNNNNKVKVMATQLLAKFEENAPTQSTGLKRQGSLRKEFPQNIGGSDVCFFCRKRVYVMERLSAEGKFFHRSCFKCDYCGTTLRLSSYAFDVEDGKFYCKPHYCYRLSGLAQRKRPAAPAPVNAKEPQVLAVTPNTVDAPGQAITSQDPVERRPSVTEVNGVTEPSVAKRLKGTPERIELENYRLSMMREEELQEVPEETLAEHNLSSVLDKATYVEEGSSSSESDMEEEDEEPEAAGPSDLGGVPWKEAVELHAKLKGESDPGAADYDNGLHDGEMDEDEEEEEDEDEEEEEEESSDEPCEEDDDPEAEAGSPDFEPGTEIDQEDIPSDAEAEARSHCIDEVVMLPVDNGKAEIQGHVSNTEKTSANPMELIVDVVLSPIQKPALPIEEVKEVSPVILVKSPGARFFPEPYLLDDVKPNIPLPLSPDAKSPYSPAAQIIALSPICSQPVPQPETTSLKSPVQHEPCACSPTGNPLSPICTQSQPCNEPPSPLSTSSPVRTQPVPAITSTPLAKPSSEKRTNEPLKDSVPEETPVKKTDLIEEFWLKSAEIRKSLGLSPLERSKPSVEKSIVKTPTPGSPSPKSFTPEDLSEEHKPSFTGRSVIRRINITLEGQVISPVEPKSSGSEKKDLSSSSGLGLNGSVTTSQTVASDSYNNSDSTMLTPPSSPPPPPPNEEPASLQNKRSQMSWDNLLEATEEPKPETTPPKPKTPVSPPQPKPLVAPVPDPGTNPPVVMRVKEPNKPRREEVRKSFVECVEEIPFADDVEETYDDHTPDTSVLERFYTPPTSKVNREKPPLHLAMENGKPNIPGGVSQTAKGPQRFSPEAKEIAEERMRAREKSVKSQALKDAMSKQLTKMKESDAAKGAVAKVAWNVPETTGKSKKQSNTLKDSAVKALESKKQTDTPPDRFFTTPTSKTLDSSVTSSESSTGGKSKKRSSLFSPRKNKKEKKAKNERLSGTEETPPKHKSLWKAVFSGYKKDKKKKDDKSCPSTSSSSTTEDSGKKKESPLDRSSDLRLRRNLSFSEDSDLSCDDVLERSSQKSKGDRHMDLFDLVSDLKKDEKSKEKDKDRAKEKGKRVTKKGKERSKERENERRVKEKIVKMKDVEKEKGKEEESVYVPHALAFKRSYATKKTYTEEELNAKLTRRVQKAARRQAKQEELKRLHRAQIIQRQLEQVEEKQRQLEERGVAVEKALRGEAGLYKGTSVSPKQRKRRSDYWGESNYSEILDLHLGGMGKKDDPKLMQEWFKLVQEKNALVRYESELMIFARELELEDRQSRLQQELRERMAVDDHLKTEKELAEEKRILNEMLEVVEQRDSLVALLEEQRLQEKEEDKDLEAVMLSKGFSLNWA
ncbi:protein-methionine sulfoxide oxidase mical3a isoform X22 [Carassius gibelio]|uniref:protein-methionine sulfoxide oxidase mical3a isoform X22 n=1 Tax=Carassius gibelio TaxID=101364 RepID=UPI002277CCED|nr:protein-methionine sulfoxide oxidase mical3a isoform X22 [Carassius gibelio]XP_052386953.1 protein-methionine sulfoxide oxidase mical3a isoform X22 [Carassius gibelio]